MSKQVACAIRISVLIIVNLSSIDRPVTLGNEMKENLQFYHPRCHCITCTALDKKA